MPVVLVYRKMDIPSVAKIRPVVPAELPVVAELTNQTWEGHNLYEPVSDDSLARFVERVPRYGLDNLLVIEDGGKIVACLGYWDWSQVTRVTVRALNAKLWAMGVLLDIARCVRPMPRMAKSGDVLTQWCLTPVAFRDPQHLAVLLGYVNNQASIRGIGQIFSVCEPNHIFFKSMRGFFRADVGLHLYVKALRRDAVLGTGPVFVDAIDL